jgi:hypothetical protein
VKLALGTVGYGGLGAQIFRHIGIHITQFTKRTPFKTNRFLRFVIKFPS